uniref:Uncharacterized protein n=1 Tax=Arundo donax TaxID=35708 RepID=A0A0A9CP19_ARUDO
MEGCRQEVKARGRSRREGGVGRGSCSGARGRQGRQRMRSVGENGVTAGEIGEGSGDVKERVKE